VSVIRFTQLNCSTSPTQLYPLIGTPGVFGPTVNVGLPLNETTVADIMKQAGYDTAITGKWHLGQRLMYLPASRGFDEYLGIPYSDDMGNALPPISCDGLSSWSWPEQVKSDDPAGTHLPLVLQQTDPNDGTINTTVLEQPLNFSTLTSKYDEFVTSFISRHKDENSNPFFLYLPFSHVHTTSETQPMKQYASCAFQNTTSRGPFGDALAEVDSIVGDVVRSLENAGLEEETLILFSSDNGPWMIQQLSAGSVGLLYARNASYWNVGKGSTWEGGIREPAFAVWPNKIKAGTRSEETVSSLDVLPTLARIANVTLPDDRVYDGKDMLDVLLNDDGKSKHEHLFFYGGASCDNVKGPSAMRYERYKIHFATGPGLGGCANCPKVCYCSDPQNDTSCRPLMFDILSDPSEAYPLEGDLYESLISNVLDLYREELKTFTFGTLVPAPDGPGEGPGKYGVCCDRKRECNCTPARSGSLNQI